jgi:thiol-disulfide isomerase/thioredoxin
MASRFLKRAFPKLRRWGFQLLILAAILAAVHWYRTRPLVEGPAPPLTARLIDPQEPIDQHTPATGPRLIHFWATWCPVCRLEQGSIAALSRDHEVITIAMQSGSATEIRSYLADRELDLPTIADPTGKIARRWGVRAVPANFIVDRDGQIRHRTVGYTSGIGLRIRLWLAEQGW